MERKIPTKEELLRILDQIKEEFMKKETVDSLLTDANAPKG
jgi:hypothetical protein